MTTSTDNKHEWRKHEKARYLPKQQPALIHIPSFKFICIQGSGNPNSAAFKARIEALYPLAYAIKMLSKKPPFSPSGHFDYTVYPLEGIWDINDRAKQNFNGTLNKDDLIYTLMLRQPNFVTEAFFQQVRTLTQNKKPNPLYADVKFVETTEGPCIQMLHVGPFETEAETFQVMEQYATDNQLSRLSKKHREIYLSDFRKTKPEKLKTVLRFQLS